jgi:hypothetical protein
MAKKKKWPKPDREFRVPVYCGRVYLCRNRERWADAQHYLIGKREEIGHSTSGNCGHYTREESGESVFLVGWFDGDPMTLIHETGHLTLNILTWVGIGPASNNGEAFCYLQEELLRLLGLEALFTPKETSHA